MVLPNFAARFVCAVVFFEWVKHPQPCQPPTLRPLTAVTEGTAHPAAEDSLRPKSVHRRDLRGGTLEESLVTDEPYDSMTAPTTEIVLAPLLIEVPASNGRGKGRVKVRKKALAEPATTVLQLAPPSYRFVPAWPRLGRPQSHAGHVDMALWRAGRRPRCLDSQGGFWRAMSPRSTPACPRNTTPHGSCCAPGSPRLS